MNADRQMQALIATQALEWFVAHRSSELTDEQREDFIDWLRASPLHAQEYLALTGFTEDVRQIVQGFSASTEKLIAQAREPERGDHGAGTVRHLFPPVEKGTTGDSASSPVAGRLRTWAVAASIALTTIALSVVGVWFLQSRPDFSTAHAEQRSWRMPDGSTVHLNSGSKIKVTFDNQRRIVDLIQGQALFQVAKDARRPFWVRAGDTVVKAVGTEFDVYRQPQRTLVSVVEGRVAISRSETQIDSVYVNAGEQATVSRRSAVVSTKTDDVQKTVAWLQRQVVFDHDPLTTAVDEFNRYSNVRIRIDDESLRHTEVSGIFSAYDAEAFIRFLEHQPDMRVERSGAEVLVTAAPPP